MNGTASGPLLKKLGLAKSPDSRVRLLKQLEKHLHRHVVGEFVKLLANPRFSDIEFPIVEKHVPFLKNLTVSDVKAACERHPNYKPSLQGILPYLDTSGQDLSWASVKPDEAEEPNVLEVIPKATKSDEDSKDDLSELRHFFLEVLNTIYNKQLANGEMDGRDGFVSYALLQSIDFASSDVDKGLALDDWNAAHLADKAFTKRCVESASKAWEKTVTNKYCCAGYSKSRVGDDRSHTLEYKKLKVKVLRALSFMEAHRQARKTFSEQLSDSTSVDATENVVLDESKAETDAAQKELDEVEKDDVLVVKSHYFCVILLNKGTCFALQLTIMNLSCLNHVINCYHLPKVAKYVEWLLEGGVLSSQEASTFLDNIEQYLVSANYCTMMDSPDEAVKSIKAVEDSLKPPVERDEPEKPISSSEVGKAKQLESVWDSDSPPVADKRGSVWDSTDPPPDQSGTKLTKMAESMDFDV